MNITKKTHKELKMIHAAEVVFGKVGFQNAKMEDVAAEAGITKVTLYSYFQSKENLYLGVTYHELQQLNDSIYKTIDRYKSNSGLECTMEIIKTFMDHCENNFLASETLLNYFSLLRQSNNGQEDTKLTEATKDSLYFLKLKDIQNIAFKLAAKEIIRGQQDGSIRKDIDPMVYTLLGWTSVIGYVKVLSAAGREAAPLFKVSIKDLRDVSLNMFKDQLTHSV